MNGHRRVRLLLYDHVRGSLTPEESREVERHLAGCPGCSAEAASHRELLRAVPALTRRPSDALPDSYWTGFANEVMGKVPAGGPERQGFFERLIGAAAGTRFGLALAGSTAARALAGLAAALAVAAVVWLALPRPAPGPEIAVTDAGPSAQESSAADTLTEFDRRLAVYFRQSKTLLVGVVNQAPGEEAVVDFDAERDASRRLLREARYLRAGPVDPRASRLMEDLDRILIGLANADAEGPVSGIETIRGGIESGNLLFKLRMQESAEFRLSVRQASYHPEK